MAEVISKVLVIYAGGTIGMCNDSILGYTPKSGYLHESLLKNPMFHDLTCMSDGLDNKHGLPSALIMPPSIFGKRTAFNILEYTPLLDSSNMTIQDWIHIAGDIEKYYHDFDAFVVLHGTDTMSYTASALSFMLENLGKTVIITGSQIPLSELRNDAASNLLGALTLAGHYVIPEVTIFFGNRLYRGNRTVKTNLSTFDAFDSPNMKPLANIGINIDIDWSSIWRSHNMKPFKARKSMNPNVTCLRLFPGITEGTVRAVLADCVQGVVLETFGAGNAPDNRPDLLEAIRSACARGVVMINISQCRTGAVSDIYATGKALSNAGVVPGLDMTTECALTKLSYLLGDKSLTVDEIRTKVMHSLAGELTRPTCQPIVSLQPSTLSELYSQLVHSLSIETKHQFDPILSTHFFHLAASKNDVASLEKVVALSKNFHVDCLDYTGNTALLTAINEGAIEATKWLLERGASIHIKDKRGRTPIQVAMFLRNAPFAGTVAARYEQIIQLLHSIGAVFQFDSDFSSKEP